MSMMLSSEQMAAVVGRTAPVEWAHVVRPVGPQEIPHWCRGVHIEWMDGYANCPTVRLKVIGDARTWPGKVFTYEPKRHLYQARHPDGRLEQYAHDGPVAMRNVKLFRRPDGTLHKDIRWDVKWGEKSGIPGLANQGPEPGEWVDAERLATTLQQGFGGAKIWVDMGDGREIALCGPWHVGAPEGYVEVSYCDVADEWFKQVRNKRRWFNVTARGGLYIKDDLFVAIMARFAPHIELVQVKNSWGITVEPLKPEWDVPKAVIYEREWQARQAARKSAA